MKVVLGTITFNDGSVDEDGCTWLLTQMDGWDSPSQKGGSVDYAGKDGTALGRATYVARALNLIGVCKAPNEDAFWKAYNRLLGLTGNLNVPIPLTAYEGSVAKTMQVVRADGVRSEIMPGHFEFDIPLTAPDPVKYGLLPVTQSLAAGATNVVFQNAGNYPTHGVEITLTTDGTLRLTHAQTKAMMTSATTEMEAGTVLDVEGRNVYYGGTNMYWQLSPRSVWFPLLPGTNRLTNTGTASLSIKHRPAWA